MTHSELVQFAVDNKTTIIEQANEIGEGYIAVTDYNGGNITPVSPNWNPFTNHISFPKGCSEKRFDAIIEDEKMYA